MTTGQNFGLGLYRLLRVLCMRATKAPARGRACAESPEAWLQVSTSYYTALDIMYGRIPLSRKNHKNIGFLSKTGPDPLKTKPEFNVGP